MSSNSSCSSGLDTSARPSFKEACKYLARYDPNAVSPPVLESVSRISAPPRVTDYLIYNEVGEGPYAKVYSVRHKTCGLDLAMKVVSKELLEGQSTQPGAVSRLFEVVEEARLLRVTQSPFALGLKAAFHDDANFYIVTKLCRTTLYDALKISAGSLSEYTMKLYIAELTCGISHLHQQGIIHRDIKLENTLIANDGHIVIADMGMAVQVETESANSPALRRVFGTPGYVAYEVVACEPYTYSVDWFSLGVIIHLLYTGEHLWFSEKYDKLFEEMTANPFKVPPGFEAYHPWETLIAGLVDYDQDARFDGNDIVKHALFRGWDWPRSNNRLMKAPAVRVDGEMITNDDPWEARWAFKVGTPYPPTNDPFPEYTWVASPTSGIEDSRHSFEDDVGSNDEGPVTDIRIDSHSPEGNGAFKYASVYDSKPVVVRSHLDVSLLGHIHIVASEASIQVAEDLLLGYISPDPPSTPTSERSSFTSSSSASSVTSEDQYVDAKDMPLDIVEVFSSVHGRLLNTGINALVPRTRTNSYSHIPAPTAPSTPTPSAGSQSGQVSVAIAWSKLTLLKKAMRSWKTKFAYKHASLAGTVPYHSIVLGYRIFVSLRGCIPMVALPLCFALGYYALVVR